MYMIKMITQAELSRLRTRFVDVSFSGTFIPLLSLLYICSSLHTHQKHNQHRIWAQRWTRCQFIDEKYVILLGGCVVLATFYKVFCDDHEWPDKRFVICPRGTCIRAHCKKITFKSTFWPMETVRNHQTTQSKSYKRPSSSRALQTSSSLSPICQLFVTAHFFATP